MLDLFLEDLWRGGVLEEYDVGGFFWSDGDLIQFSYCLFIYIFVV